MRWIGILKKAEKKRQYRTLIQAALREVEGDFILTTEAMRKVLDKLLAEAVTKLDIAKKAMATKADDGSPVRHRTYMMLINSIQRMHNDIRDLEKCTEEYLRA